jgi:hypothetical protein
MCFAAYFNYTFLAAERGGTPYVYSKRSKKKPFTFMHCYLEFVKYPKWELRELEVSHKKQKKKSDASPGVSAAAIIDDDLSVSSKILEREEAPSDTKHEKEARKVKIPCLMVVLASYRYNLCGHKSKRRMR